VATMPKANVMGISGLGTRTDQTTPRSPNSSAKRSTIVNAFPFE
jgi:hypothetical protein